MRRVLRLPLGWLELERVEERDGNQKHRLVAPAVASSPAARPTVFTPSRPGPPMQATSSGPACLQEQTPLRISIG